MTPDSLTVTRLATYRNETRYPFCPGCGHGPILDHLDRALASLELDPRRIVIVSDIGCSGLSDQHFSTSAFHGLHGRSLTYATGIKLARPELKVIVLMGDGGAGIGGAHLINAARRNIGLTLLVMNNLNFGMTGGQHSVATPPGGITTTTPRGNLERPLDICATCAVNGAGYVYRGTNFEADLSERIAEAVASEGFAVLDVWDLCTAHYVPRNKASRKSLATLMDELGFEHGLLRRTARPEYARALRQASPELEGRPTLAPDPLPVLFESPLTRRFSLVIAGSAGGRVRTAARLAGKAAILSGLWASQRDDYPITVKTGHSVSELVFAPAEIHYTGITRPDALLVLSEDGLAKAGPYLARMSSGADVFVLPGLPDVRTAARVHTIEPDASRKRLGSSERALYGLTRVLDQVQLLPPEALPEAARRSREPLREGQLALIHAARAITPGVVRGTLSTA